MVDACGSDYRKIDEGLPKYNHMFERLNEKISVVCFYDRVSGLVMPWKLKWNGRVYKVTKLGFHHTIRDGRTLFHIFSVTAGELFFRLKLNTDNLHWSLEEISDGLTN